MTAASGSVSVREAVEGDAPDIAEAHVRSWQAAYEGIIPADFLDGLDVTERTEHWASILRSEVEVPGVATPTNLVAELDGRVVGFACIGDFRDDPSPEAGELWAMYAHPDQWAAGVGRALMIETLAHFRANDRRVGHLWVLTDNDRARRFYQRAGWAVAEGEEPPATKQFEIAGQSIEEVRYRIDL